MASGLGAEVAVDGDASSRCLIRPQELLDLFDCRALCPCGNHGHSVRNSFERRRCVGRDNRACLRCVLGSPRAVLHDANCGLPIDQMASGLGAEVAVDGDASSRCLIRPQELLDLFDCRALCPCGNHGHSVRNSEVRCSGAGPVNRAPHLKRAGGGLLGIHRRSGRAVPGNRRTIRDDSDGALAVQGGQAHADAFRCWHGSGLGAAVIVLENLVPVPAVVNGVAVRAPLAHASAVTEAGAVDHDGDDVVGGGLGRRRRKRDNPDRSDRCSNHPSTQTQCVHVIKS